MQRDQATPHVCDRDRLDSALNRAHHVAHYDEIDFVTQVAFLIVAIPINHPFMDGNKRTGLVAGEWFLLLNRWRLIGDRLRLAKWVEDVVIAEQKKEFEPIMVEFTAWLRANVRPLSHMLTDRRRRRTPLPPD